MLEQTDGMDTEVVRLWMESGEIERALPRLPRAVDDVRMRGDLHEAFRWLNDALRGSEGLDGESQRTLALLKVLRARVVRAL